MTPVLFRWTGEAMVPLERHQKLAQRNFWEGATYPLVIHEERSQASHRQYFAAVREGWQNLPEHLAERFPSEEHLRKWALIKAGYCKKHEIVAPYQSEAVKIVEVLRSLDEYVVASVTETVVTVYTAKSQSLRAMGKKEFQASKEKVLDVIAGLLEVERKELEDVG